MNEVAKTDFSQWGVLITLIGGILLQFYNDYKANKRRDKQDEKMEEQNAKLDVIHETTNSLSERNEVIAQQLGIEQGKSQERANQGVKPKRKR